MHRIVIVGAGGYSGAELAAILLHHPHARIVALFGSGRRAEGTPARMGDMFPRLRGRLDLPLLPADTGAILDHRPDAVFLATPHEASLDLAVELADRGPVVLDLSGAFRLKDAALYPKFYGFEHRHPKLLERAVYGLAELNRAALAHADLVAVPGCYPTSAIIPLAPLVRAGAIEPGRRPIVDSVSGVSGAGRTPSPRTHFCEVSLQPYNVLRHRHGPEIDAYAGTPVFFTPHLGPYDRGIVSTIHVDLVRGWDGRRVEETMRGAYADEPFIRLLPSGQWPSAGGVRGTNFCDIAWVTEEPSRGDAPPTAPHLILVSAIDNLVKGAAGQAVQCMNIRFGLPEVTGLRGDSP
jgi:N-acetyl-gamma-glutamyl-phosphate reductase